MKSRVNRILVIVGPTASGKSALAVQAAKALSGEIISADSRQVYRGLDLGSGKITKREMKGVPHHLLNVASPKKTFTVADYRRKARKTLLDIARRGKFPIVCGGTGHYIDALLYDYDLPQVKPNEKLRKALYLKPTEELFAELSLKDPLRATSIDRLNRRRLVRALEIVLTTKKPVPSLPIEKKHWKNFEIIKIGISRTPNDLKMRISKRLRERIKKGMIAEVRHLKKHGVSDNRLETLGLEYRRITEYLSGKITKAEMLRSIEAESIQYAKRQMTWWKKDVEITWFHDTRSALRIARKKCAQGERV
ncbi:MAG: tRNA (adenosine(37)-N6)-dimethylallyltransferase MiaA [Patescibacteria group bacterium]